MPASSSKLLMSLGCNLPDIEKEVKRQCPLHLSNIRTLEVKEAQDGPRFICHDPGCGFSGDALELASRVRNQDPLSTALEFIRGGSLAHVMDTPISRPEAEIWARTVSSQAQAKAWIKACSESLRLGGSIPGLPSKPEQWPQELGLLCESPFLSSRDAHRAGSDLVFPFTYEGEVRSVVTKNPVANEPWAVDVCIAGDGGLFMENNVKGARDTMLLTFNPEPAAFAAARLSGISARLPPIACLRGNRLPPAYINLKHIIILSAPDTRADLSSLLMLAGVQGPRLWVKDLEKPAAFTQVEEFTRLLNSEYRGQSLIQRIVDVTEKMIEDGKDAEHEIGSAGLSKAVAEKLAKASDEAGNRKSAELYRRIRDLGAGTVRLANGFIVKSEASSLYGVGRSGEKVALANFGVRVEAKELGEGEIKYLVSVSPESAPSVKVRVVPGRSCDARIVAEADAAYARLGLCPYLWADSCNGYSWVDILQKLGEGCGTGYEVSRLGACIDGTLRFPGTAYNPGLDTLENMETMAEGVASELYDNTIVTGEDRSEAYKRLFSDSKNFYSVGLCLAISHIALEQSRALYYASRRKPFSLRHLMFVDEESGDWRRTLQQLSLILNDTEFPGKPVDGAKESAKAYSGLGSLPLPLNLDGYSAKDVSTLLQRVESGIIARVDASALQGSMDRCAYVSIPGPDTGSEPDIAGVDLTELRRGIVRFLGFAIRELDKAGDSRLAANPVLSAYRTICRGLGVPVTNLASDICNDAYVGRKSGIVSFLGDISRRLRSDPLSVGVMAEAGAEHFEAADIAVGKTFTAIRNEVAGSPKLAALMRYDARRLGIAADEGPFKEHIVITKKAWDRYVATPLKFNPAPLLAGEIADSAAGG
jgi:hypothetical protein